MFKKTNGNKLYNFAKNYLVSGSSSSTRWSNALGRPLYFKKGIGSRLIDIDGNEIKDNCCSNYWRLQYIWW